MTDRAYKRFEIATAEDLAEHLSGGNDLDDYVIHGIDLAQIDGLSHVSVDNCLFLGCRFVNQSQRSRLEERGAYVFPEFADIPYNPYRHELYTSGELLSGYDEHGYAGTLDFRIYAHFDRSRASEGGVSIRESLAQRIHDHAIDDALYQFVADRGGRTIVGIMGGHSTSRADADYAKVVRLCRSLTRRGYLVATGGGPGVMEAGNLGAFLSNFDDDAVVEAALEILTEAPRYDGGHPEGTPEYLGAIESYIAAARETRQALVSDDFARRYTRSSELPGRSLAVPTWFYGHEPTNLFCDSVAKYFSNGLREDVLLAIARGGVVFAPGSAGTMQEIFMDLAQNHYATFVDRSPMVFLGRERFTPTYELIRHFITEKGMDDVYGDLVALFDDPDEVVTFIEEHPPRARELKIPLYDLT